MGIAKMTLVNITGELKYLDEALLRCTYSSAFHPEQASELGEYASTITTLREDNPYTGLVARLTDVAAALGVSLTDAPSKSCSLQQREVAQAVEELESKVGALAERKKSLEQTISNHKQTINHLKHLIGMDARFDELFACEFLKIRFGRLPVDSYEKLSFYQDRPYVFFSFEADKDYHWCMYITSAAYKEEIDALFASLFFERLRIPGYARGTPKSALDFVTNQLEVQKKELAAVEQEIAQLAKQQGEQLHHLYADIEFLESLFNMRLQAAEMRRYANVRSSTFAVVGFIPKKEEKNFLRHFEGLDVEVNLSPAESDTRLNPPVLLKNSLFAKPYEMYVKMYGMPSYKDIDPTPLVAITYTLLFGIMFGDVGQGLLISLIGWLMYKMKGMELGRIMVRMGFSSAIFGVAYGSIFGFEHLLDPMFHALGFEEKPIHIMAPSTTNVILLGAVGMGIAIIMISIFMNILVGIKRKNWERALFSHNGLAGLVFYGGVVFGVVSSMLFDKAVFTPPYIICFIALPLVLIFCKEPLGRLLAGKKELFHEGVGGFIVESFFEMFEVLLSFVSNTMSFLRVGGFILSHAGMMAVVFTLSEMVSAGASPVVIIIGNLFVMALEGLIVGIQVLRLEFYEIFSRFFDGDGKPFEPVIARCVPEQA